MEITFKIYTEPRSRSADLKIICRQSSLIGQIIIFINKDAKKKIFVWAVHDKREPQRHLLEKNGT